MKVFFDFEFIEKGSAFVMEPISVGMAREDGQTYYAEFDDVDWSKAHDWVLSNVKPYLYGGEYVKSKEVIKNEIIEFVGDSPEFWAYYADYDWVLLCQLYGPMIDLPSSWPMWCRDLKQLMWHLNVTNEKDFTVINENPHVALYDAIWNRKVYETIKNPMGENTDQFSFTVQNLNWMTT